MARILETKIQKRFSDVDSFQHVNNVAQQMYFDLGKTDYYNRVLCEDVLLGDHVRIITASTQTSYLGQVRLYDDVTVLTQCERVGNTSMVFLQQITVGGEVRSESRSVMVAFDFTEQKSVPIPDEWRRRMTEE